MTGWKGIRLRLLAAALAGGLLVSGTGLPGLSGAAETVYAAEPLTRLQEAAAEAPAMGTLNAQSAVLMDGDTGRVLYGKNADEMRPMASTTKIMTCILALENAKPDETVEVSEYAASMPDVQLGIRAGERYRLEDLLFSLMLESHNDSAVAVAEHVGGSVERFAEMMNQKARELGCTSTHFITPNGLDAKDGETGEFHGTTATELARILRYCVCLSPKREEFLRITRMASHAFGDLDGKRSFSCVNHNALLTSMDGALSGKTGFTGEAGFCYVGAVKKGEKTFIAALLACGWPPHKTYKWQDMKKLIAYGNQNYEYREIALDEVELPEIMVPDGIQTQLGLRLGETVTTAGEGSEIVLGGWQDSGGQAAAAEGETLRILMRADESVRVRKRTPKRLAAPVAEGQTVGQVDYYIGGDLIASRPIETAGATGRWTLLTCADALAERFFSLADWRKAVYSIRNGSDPGRTAADGG